jgi:DNA-binding IscR family transcriptional regulator
VSHHLTNLAWNVELRGMQKLVLLCLAHQSLQSTRECAVTVRRIAFMCGISHSTVRAQIAALCVAGLVEEIQGNGETFYRVNVAPQETV